MNGTYPHELAGEECDAPATPSPLEFAAARAELASRPPVGMAHELLTARPWRKAGGVEQLFAEANAANPARDKTSDGTIGNASHAANWEASDHNPFVVLAGVGIVRAGDVDADGVDLAGAMERMRVGTLNGTIAQFAEGGYGIYNRRITAPDFSGWRVYKGSNPHILHGHFSFSRVAWRFDNRSPMGLFLPAHTGGFLMALSDAQQDEALTLLRDIANRVATASIKARGYDMLQSIESLTAQTLAAVRTLPAAGDVVDLDPDDVATLAAGLVDSLPPALAAALADELADRLATRR